MSAGETDRIYLMIRHGWNLTDRYYGNSYPYVEGIAFDLRRQVVEARRRRQKKALERAKNDGWGTDDLWDYYASPSDVYSVPVNRMVKASKTRKLYGYRWSKAIDRGVWGVIGTDVTAAEVAAVQARLRYRVEHRDGDDPVRAVIEDEAKRLPRPLREKDVARVYVVARWFTLRREFGIFTTYEQALDAATEDATIIEVPATGHDDLRSAKLVRGQFPTGWGYASGYAPSKAGRALNGRGVRRRHRRVLRP